MAKPKIADEIQKQRALVTDETRPPEARLNSARKLLRDFGHTVVNVKMSKRIAKLFLSDQAQSAEVRKRAGSLLEFAIKETETEEEQSEADTIKAPAILGLDSSAEEVLEVRNKDARFEPVANKFIYFPRNDRGYLMQNFADLYDLLGFAKTEDLPESLFDDPYNQLTEAAGRFHRTINPKYLSQFVSWKRARFGDTFPPRDSIYFWLFVNEEECRRWNKLGTINCPEEQPVGTELRKRLLRSGDMKRSEIPFSWDLWWQILLKKPDEVYWMPADTPNQYLTEFTGIELKPVAAAPLPAVKAKPAELEPASIPQMAQPAPKIQRAIQLAPIGAPKEVCSFCFGVPPEAVPPHRCSDYQSLAQFKNDYVDLNSMNNREASRSRDTAVQAANALNAQDEKIKEKIVKMGFGHAIQGNRVLFDNVLISFTEWQKHHEGI